MRPAPASGCASVQLHFVATGRMPRRALPRSAVDNRRRVLGLIENMTLGGNAVGYLTESVHGAGSPQAQRVQSARLANFEEKKELTKKLAGVVDGDTGEGPR